MTSRGRSTASFANLEDLNGDITQTGKVTIDEIIVQLRLKYLQILKSIYWNAYESDAMQSSTFIALNEAVDIALDNK
jgi:hypothetical protein